MVNLTLQPRSIDSLLSGVVHASTNSNLVTPTQAVINKFTEVFLLFRKCHAVYNGNVVDDKAITQLGKTIICKRTYSCFTSSPLELDIQVFLTYFRISFPSSTIIPKMHILEDHTVTWLKRWHLGAGFMGEQGAESVHAHVHKLEANYSGITNRLD